MVAYCSPECQKSHWKEAHKVVCSRLNDKAKSEGKRIITELKNNDASSLITLQRNDIVYTVAKKHGLFPVMEHLFRMEMEGQTCEGCYSYTQDIIVNIFKGNREVIDRFTCACPIRSKEFILSSPTAWYSLMDAMLYLAKSMTNKEFQTHNMTIHIEREIGLLHRAARDACVTINLALIHKKVATAIFFGEKRTQEEAREYALSLAAKLKVLFRNGGEGFAPESVDRNQTIQGNVFQFTAMLSYWYRTLGINPVNPNAFIEAMELTDFQDTMRMQHLQFRWGKG